MDLATLMGLLLALGMVLMGITVDFAPFDFDITKIVFFIDPSSILIVIGGTFGSVLASFPMVKIMRVGRVVARAFRKTPDEEMINTLTFIVDIAKIARQNILGIENVLETVENDYLRNGLRLVLDRVDRDLIVEILHSELHYLEKRRDEDIKILRTFASLGPAFGMIGT
ncbi:MAG: MotA/TolQ/ExbB proton channel family protein, partial [bacterium]